MDFQHTGCLSCGVCRDGSTFRGTEALKTHFKHRHDPLSSYPCGQLECGKFFLNKTSMVRHITSAHEVLFHQDEAGPSGTQINTPHFQPSLASTSQQHPFYDSDGDTFSICLEDDDTTPAQQADELSLQEQLNNAAAQLLIDLRSRASLTGKAIERFESGCTQMIQNFCGSLNELLSSRLQQKGLSGVEAAEILKDINDIKDPFENLKSIEQQLNYFEEKYGLVKPEEKYLDDRIDKRLDPKTNSYVQTQVSESFQYVPIAKTLEAILSNKKIRSKIFKDLASKDGVLRSYVDGSNFKDHPFLKKHSNVLHILLFYDELEVTNALGSKTIIHKLACFFFQILNLPPESSSELSSIHLLALAYADDMKKPGTFKKVLAAFCKDMRKLSSEEGIEINLDGEPFVLRAILVALTADTPAAHDLLGFLGVGARHFCRKCMVSRKEVRANGNASGAPRTPELHKVHVEEVERRKKFSTQCGVKGSCPLDRVPYFHCVENCVFDAFHDLLEGVVPLLMKLVLRHYITKSKLLTWEDLNTRIASFDYGFPDSKNKPSANFTLDMLTNATGKLKQTGSQMWCLMRALPFVLGDLVVEEEPHMQLLFLLQNIMQVIFSFEIRPEDIDRLETLIYSHNESFKTLFIDSMEHLDDLVEVELEVEDEELVEEEGLEEEEEQQEQQEEVSGDRAPKKQKKAPFKVYITNKLHHLTHYPDMVRQYGPPVRFWCAKFEGRMKIFRQHSSVCCNFKNPPKTMAQMFQLSNLKSILNESADRGIEYHAGKIIQFSDSFHSALFLAENMTGTEELIYTNSATVNGEEYRPGLFVCLPESTSLRISFAVISEVIIVDKKSVYLTVKPWGNSGVSKKLNACHVFPLENPEVRAINAKSLANFRCIAPWTVGNKADIFLSLRTTVL